MVGEVGVIQGTPAASMIFTIIQVVLLILILVAVVPNIVRTFRAGRLKMGFGLLITILGILGVISSIYLSVTRVYKPMDPRVYDKIQQLDAANVAADIERFHKDHPQVKGTVQLEKFSDQGIVDERSIDRRINRFLCRVSEFFTPPVKLPKGYYLKESYGVVSLHDRQGKVILDESAPEFLVKEPYVAVWGCKVVYFLNTDSGEITSCTNQDYKELRKRSSELGFDSLRWSDCLTFWDIKTGYKPVTWSQK